MWLGEVECIVTALNDSHITCTVQAHAAGRVQVSVHIPGKGYASVNGSVVCFSYVLSVTDIRPASGSTEGGTQVSISGHGFLPTFSINSSTIGAPLASLAWLANGFGWPRLSPLPSLCPDLAEELENFTNLALSVEELTLQQFLLNLDDENATLLDLQGLDKLQMLLARLYRDLPIRVFIGSAPCIVTWANLTDLVCTTTQHDDGMVNITVSVFAEAASFKGYTYDTDLTPTVFSIRPNSGPVYGGTVLTIEGRALLNTISVMIGDAPCLIMSRNSTDVLCTTTSHAPASLPVTVSTSQGLAKVAMEGSGVLLLLVNPFFFSYELQVNSVGPPEGSVLGGQLLTVEGRGFHPSLTSILIGGRLATVRSASETMVQCITPAPTQTHTITLVDGGYNFGECRDTYVLNNYCV